MGDSTVQILLDISSFASYTGDNASKHALRSYEKISRVVSADTTLREVFDIVHNEVKSRCNHRDLNLAIYDCTVYPVKRVRLIKGQNDATSGVGAVTLQSLGWWPGARIAVCSANDADAQHRIMVHDLREDAWSVPEVISDPVNNPVRLLDDQYVSSRPMPSELLDSISRRHDKDNSTVDTKDTVKPNKSLQSRETLERERSLRIDERIRKIEEQTKKKPSAVSSQVRKMLIKSSAKGNKKLTEGDRFYLEVLVVEDMNDDQNFSLSSKGSSSFYFFSKMSTIGKVIESVCKTSSNFSLEFLICMDSKEASYSRYWRIPNLVPLHEAEKKGLEQFSKVIIRKFSNGELYTKSITEVDLLSEKEENFPRCTKVPSFVEKNETSSTEAHSVELSGGINNVEESFAERLRSFIDNLNAEASKVKKGKSKTSEKVQQMLMKSKAKGDKKNIKAENRFYLEVVIIGEVKDPLEGTSSFWFFDKRSSIGRTCLILLPNDLERDIEAIALSPTSCYRIPHEVKLCNAEAKGLIKQFGKIVLRRRQD